MPRERLLGDGQRLAEAPGEEQRQHEDAPKRELQPRIVTPVRQADRLPQGLDCLLRRAAQGSGGGGRRGEDRLQAQVAALVGERLQVRQECGRLLARHADAYAEAEDVRARRAAELPCLGGFGQPLEELPSLAPVAQGLGEIAHADPFGRTSAPARGLQRLPRARPVVGEERRTFVELARIQVRDDACDRRVHAAHGQEGV